MKISVHNYQHSSDFVGASRWPGRDFGDDGDDDEDHHLTIVVLKS
mgnify:FL=1